MKVPQDAGTPEFQGASPTETARWLIGQIRSDVEELYDLLGALTELTDKHAEVRALADAAFGPDLLAPQRVTAMRRRRRRR